jgi:lipid II:glycine glycyltransferase (peptidoglycan interpeptide bridge formation enzyme)
MVAATNNAGRNSSAAYSMITNLLSHLAGKGVKKFDFGGIDPGNLAAQGVDHFKMGFGGKIKQPLGEWEFMSSELARFGMNLGLLKSRRRT